MLQMRRVSFYPTEADMRDYATMLSLKIEHDMPEDAPTGFVAAPELTLMVHALVCLYSAHQHSAPLLRAFMVEGGMLALVGLLRNGNRVVCGQVRLRQVDTHGCCKARTVRERSAWIMAPAHAACANGAPALCWHSQGGRSVGL
jgi:hypothetical protein